MHYYNTIFRMILFIYVTVVVKALFQTFQCIGCRFDPDIIAKYFKCHSLLPGRIRVSGEKCIRGITKSNNRIEQWRGICSSRDKFMEVFLCTNVSKGSLSGAAGKREKLGMLRYLGCIYRIKMDDCMGERNKEKLKYFAEEAKKRDNQK